MTKTLLKLQLMLWGRTIKGNRASLVMMLMISIYSFFGLIGFSLLLGFSLEQDQFGILAGIVTIGMLAYCVVAFMWPSGEGQLDPRVFATMPLEAKQLLPGFAISTLMQSRGITAVVCTLVTTIVAAIFMPPSSWPILVVMMLVSLITTLLLGELLGAVASGSSSSVSKDRKTVLTSVVFIVFILGYNLLIGADAMSRINVIGTYTKWTPLAAGAGAAEAFAAGLWLEAGILTVLALGYVTAGVWLWLRLINQALTAPLDQGGRGKNAKKTTDDGKKALFIPGVPWSVGGAIFSRSLRYLVKDSRLLGSLIVFPMLGLLFIFQSFTVEFFMIYVGLIMMAVFAGSIATNDFGYDGPASWLNIVSGVKAKTILLPRHWASMLPGGISLVAYIILTIVLAENKTTAVLLSFIGLGIFISGAAVALFVSTFNPYPTSKPGTNPWGDRSGYSGAAFIGAFAALFLGWIPTIPTIALGVFGLVSGQMWMVVLAEVLAVILPAAVYVATAKMCIAKVEKNLPEIFDKVKTHVK
ncbi:ABC transporter permease [Corynebacterium suranareeae]|uniref:ABC transporter permease n=1 Tax=Corynebacterium suranareeae TaxID=2506452 RepID=A0A169RZR6_9CORY|nr:hypothetical protein [Corynebacterium suranareeae]BAU96352.1 ABC transporter permease [Corynebacterium suranareeae]